MLNFAVAAVVVVDDDEGPDVSLFPELKEVCKLDFL